MLLRSRAFFSECVYVQLSRRKSSDAFVPPNPKLFEIAARIGVLRDTVCTCSQDQCAASLSCCWKLSVGGTWPCCTASTVKAACARGAQINRVFLELTHHPRSNRESPGRAQQMPGRSLCRAHKQRALAWSSLRVE